MNSIKLTFAIPLALAAILTSVSCDDGGGGGGVSMVGGRAAPAVGSTVDVQFRRNYLGLASDKPSTPMGEGMNMNLGSSGIMKALTDDFLVLQVHGEENRELWIPREAILLLDVKCVTAE